MVWDSETEGQRPCEQARPGEQVTARLSDNQLTSPVTDTFPQNMHQKTSAHDTALHGHTTCLKILVLSEDTD